MGNELSTVGGAVATAATSVAVAATFGQVRALNEAAVECAKFTAECAQETTVRHVGETAAHALATAGVAVAAGVTLGQVKDLNDMLEECADNTAASAVKAAKGVVQIVDEVSDGIPVVAHVKGGILYAAGESERGERAMKSGTRTLGAMAGGVTGFVVGGPVGAFAGGVAGGAAVDGIFTGVESAVYGEFRPNGQIAAWDAVAKGDSPHDIIGGVVAGVLTPVLDGAAGLGAGKAFAEWKVNKELNIMEKLKEGQGNISRKAFEAQERISRNKTPAGEYEQARPPAEATFDGCPIPRGAMADESITVYRGDRGLLQEGRIDAVFKDGVEPRGAINDAYLHAIGQEDCNFVSTTKDVGVARRFGRASDGNPATAADAYAIMKLKPKLGIDLQITADMLDRLNPYPAEAEVSIFRGIRSQDIEAVLVRDSNGFTWHPNPNYVAPAFHPRETPTFLGAILIVSSAAFRRATESE